MCLVATIMGSAVLSTHLLLSQIAAPASLPQEVLEFLYPHNSVASSTPGSHLDDVVLDLVGEPNAK